MSGHATAGSGASLPRSTALVTGASSGIGNELANVFASKGHDVVLVARNKERLRRAADELADRYGVSASFIASDLAVPGAADELYADLSERAVHVDYLVNNAGFGAYGRFTDTDSAEESEMMQLNMVTLTQLTKLFLPAMVERRRGRILNVASTAAFQPGPLMAVYYATKAYVLSLSEALSEELRGTGVTVTALCPGPTRSEFQERAKLGDSRLLRVGIMDARSVAVAGYEGMMKRRAIVVPGVKNKALAKLAQFSPRAVTTRTVHFLQRRLS